MPLFLRRKAGTWCHFSSALPAASARGANASADAVAAPRESSPSQPLNQGGKEPRKLLGNNRRLSSLSHAARACQPQETSFPRGGSPAWNRRGPWSQQRRRLRSNPAACRPSSGLRQGSFVQLTNGSPAALRATRRSAGLARARNRSPSLNHQAQPRGRRGSRNARWKMCPSSTSTSTGPRKGK